MNITRSLKLDERHTIYYSQVNNILVGYITKSLKRLGKHGQKENIIAIYLGFDSFSEANEFAKKLKGNRVFTRKARRLFDCLFEVKIQGTNVFSLQEIEDLCSRHFSYKEVNVNVKNLYPPKKTYYKDSVLEVWELFSDVALQKNLFPYLLVADGVAIATFFYERDAIIARNKINNIYASLPKQKKRSMALFC